MNETKKVNEISSKKNFGEYSQKIHRRSDKAITLIALIVTIIILLILTGVSATILIGDNSIINKAKYAREVSRGSAVKEYVDMAELNNILAEYVKKNNITRSQAIYELHKDGKLTDKEVMLLNTQDVITIGGINIDFSILGTPEVGKVYIAWRRGVGFYAQSDGKLYSFNSTIPTYYDKDFELTYIRDDIKGFNRLSGKYLTNSNELYEYDSSSKQYEKVGDNVKEDYGDAYLTNSNELYKYNYDSNQYEKVAYLTNSNELYKYNSSSKQYERVGEAKDLKKYYGGAYLTNSNELYQYNGSQYEKVGENVKEYDEYMVVYYLTNSNELYGYNSSSKQYEKVGDNVKEFSELLNEYLTNSNELYRYNSSSKKHEKVGENVKEFSELLNEYLTNSNELYRYNSISKKYEKVGDNVKELKRYYYITNSDEIYAYNDYHKKYEKIEVNVGDIKEFGENYFITKDNKIRVWNTEDNDVME